MAQSIRFGVIAMLVNLFAITLAAAQTPAARPERVVSPHGVVLFNIPAEPLSDALEAYGAVTGYQIIYDSTLAQGRRSTAVVGLFAPETALRMLLQGTDLTLRHSGPADITLLASSAVRLDGRTVMPGAAAAAGGGGDEMVLDTLYIDVPAGTKANPGYSNYGRVVQRKVRQALLSDDTTAHRAYQVQMDIWIDEKGRAKRPKIVQSTAAVQLNRSILAVVDSAVFDDPPPRGMPQPIRITIIAF